MPDLPRSHLLAYGLALLAVVGFGLRQVARSAGADAPAGEPVPTATGGAPDGRASAPAGGGARELVVHVAGLVRRPGVYRFADGARVQDAVRRAGGARRGADLAALNLAAELEDGRQVLVPPRAGAAGAGVAPGSGGAAVAGGAAVGGSGTAAAAGGGGSGALGAPAAPPVNLNTATLEQLDTLDGVGPVTAQKILAYRQEHGGFGSVDELGEIPGIGPKRMETLRELVTV